MIETAIVAFATFFATVGPPDVAAMFAVLTADDTPRERRRTALRGRGTPIAADSSWAFFAFAGEVMLGALGISLPALRIAGGILLFLIGIDMVFAVNSGGTSTTAEETQEAKTKADIAVFPLATPLIAGPGAMGAAILLMSDTGGDFLLKVAVIGALFAVLLLTLVGMLVATQLQRFLGVTGMHVITRVLGVLLSALAVQFVLDGLLASGLFTA
ncbi:MAG: MarC family protein [Woeseiaceae bacterium]|nr:MarC family protein [Woeseiaceae bacterium]